MSNMRRRRSVVLKAMAVISILTLAIGVLAATGVLQAQKERTTPKGNKASQANKGIVPADASSPSKEYVYVGGKLIATEEGSGGGGGGCTFSLTPTSNPNVPASGGQYQITIGIVSGTNCSWNATANVSWITFPSGSSGTGAGTLNYTVAASTNPSSQTGTISLGSVNFTVTQAGTSCTYSLSATSPSQPFSAAGGTGSFTVNAGTGCNWTATTNASWITITAPSGGSGSGTGPVNYTVAPNTGQSALTGTISVAGQTYTITESGPCTYSLDQTSIEFQASGGNQTINITAGASCQWNDTKNAIWLSLTPVSTCSPPCGNGQLICTADPNPTTQIRTATIGIGDKTVTVTQDAGCALTFSPSTLNFASGGATESITVSTAGSSCSWTAAAVDPWITVSSQTSTTIGLTVGMNPDTTSRSGSITITNNGFVYNYTLTQDGSVCGYTVTTNPSTNPPTINATQPGGTFTNGVNVATGSGCQWTAASNVTWILVEGGNGGPVMFTGSSGVSFIVNPNTGSATRTGTMTIAGVTVTVTQPGTCSYSLSSSSQPFLAAGGTGSFTVATSSSCSWTASSNASWVTITSGSSGSGNGTVAYSVAANTGTGSRSGTITAAGKTLTVTQAGVPANCPTVSTFSGTGVYGYLEGNPTTAKWANPNSIATAKEPAGANAVFIADTDNSRIRMVYIDGANAGQSVLVAGNGTAGYSPPGSNATTVSINSPRGLAVLTNSSGVVTAIFFADTGNNMIRKLTPPAGGSGPWAIADFSGSGIAGYTDGAPGSAQFNAPQGVAVAANGTVYVADSSNSFIRALDTSGNASTFAGGSNVGMKTPVGVTISKNTGTLYVTDVGIHSIFSVGSSGFPVTRIAGSGSAGFADATGSAAKFNSPYQLAWATTTADGEVLYIADRQNQRIRKLVISSNSVTTYVGSGTGGFLDSTCQSAEFDLPSGVGVGSLGELYVADSTNNRIRKVQ